MEAVCVVCIVNVAKFQKCNKGISYNFHFFLLFAAFLLFSSRFSLLQFTFCELFCTVFLFSSLFFRVTFNHAVALRHTAFIIIQNQIGTNGIRTCVFSLNYYYVLCVCCLLCGIQQSVPFHINWTMYERLRCEYE